MTRPNTRTFSVRVSCIDVTPGTYAEDVDAVLRQTRVGTAHVRVTCVKGQTVVRPRPLQQAAAGVDGNPPAPPGQPVVNVVAPVAPVPPVTQPQVQPQTQPQTQAQVQGQAQLQPLTAAAMQEQQQLQVALALNTPGEEQVTSMGMVDRRRRQEVQALGVLAFAMTACGGLGLARLRSRPDVARQRR